MSQEADLNLERANLRDLLASSSDETQPSSEPPPPVYHYRVALILPPPVEQMINEARQIAKLDLLPIGTFSLKTAFTATDEGLLKDTVRGWVGAHLPLDLHLERLESYVIGVNRYLLTLRLTPAERLAQAQAELSVRLASLTTPVGANGEPFMPRLPIADHVPAPAFPLLIHAAQARFKPQAWRATGVEILRTVEGDERWEVWERLNA